MFTLQEREKILVYMAALIARDRRQKGLLLNYPEAVAIITSQIIEWAREGKTVAQVMNLGTTLLKREELLPGVPEMIESVQVEATFRDGTKLVTVHNPVI